jgi:TATA-box binding protein (TBP) (component of TFIID and TFIIIB)
MLTFSQLRVSTMTCTAAVGSDVDLEAAYDSLTLAAEGEHGVVSVRRADCSSTRPPELHLPGKTAFGRQLTMYVRSTRVSPRLISTKLFHNGTLHVAGATTEAEGHEACQLMLDSLAPGMPTEYFDFRVRMINSDMHASSILCRATLYDAFRAAGDVAAYDPSIYPALKLKLFYPVDEDPYSQDGACRCAHHCVTKLSRHRNCVMITASIYGSGCVVMTGSGSLRHVARAREVTMDKVGAVCDGAAPHTPAQRIQRMKERKAAAAAKGEAPAAAALASA